MRSFRVIVTLLAALPAAAQGELDATVQQYERVRTRNEQQRGPIIDRLGSFVDERVTGVLLDELAAAKTAAYTVRVLNAIGAHPRPRSLRPLQDALLDPRAPRTVVRAAARALTAQGHRGIDFVVDLVYEPPTQAPVGLRDACIEALAAAHNERAWRALAGMSMVGSAKERLRLLRLLHDAGNLSAATRARLSALESEDLALAATAFQQLAEQGHARARRAAEDLHERVGERPPVSIRVALVRGIAKVLHRDLYSALLQQAASDHKAVRQAVIEVSVEVAKDSRFVRWLVEEGLEASTPDERAAARHFLTAADPRVAQAALTSFRRQLRSPTRDDLDKALTLHPLLASDPTWKDDVLKLAGSSKAELRAAGLSLLAELEAPEGLPIALRSIEHSDWPVRAAAYGFCTKVRHASSIPVLIRRIGRETPRLEQDLLDTLMSLTGRRFWQRRQWDEWWETSADGFSLPPPIQMKGGSSSGGNTISYYDIPLVSNRVAFVLDVSGSMNNPIGTSRKLTRLTEAKRQLRNVIGALPDDFMFNVITYQSTVTSLMERLRKARARNKEEALTAIADLKARGGTNIYDALEEAFNDPDVDTVYLLSDGQPSEGRISDVTDLAEEISRWNRTRQIRIHGISVGMDSLLLRRLADESGGTYVYVR